MAEITLVLGDKRGGLPRPFGPRRRTPTTISGEVHVFSDEATIAQGTGHQTTDGQRTFLGEVHEAGNKKQRKQA